MLFISKSQHTVAWKLKFTDAYWLRPKLNQLDKSCILLQTLQLTTEQSALLHRLLSMEIKDQKILRKLRRRRGKAEPGDVSFLWSRDHSGKVLSVGTPIEKMSSRLIRFQQVFFDQKSDFTLDHSKKCCERTSRWPIENLCPNWNLLLGIISGLGLASLFRNRHYYRTCSVWI